MRVLALDYGLARIGCAVSGGNGPAATRGAAIESAAGRGGGSVAKEREVEGIVVGLPVSLSGEEGGQAELTRAFCEDLESVTELPVKTYDERFTTRMAAQTRRASGAGAAEDSIAAAHLLESYLVASAREMDA